MAGAVANCELSTRFAVATPADDAAIRRLLRENPMPGVVSLTLEREPYYFRGANIAGGDDQTIVAFSDERLVCMGRCSRRERWVNGVALEVGYLAELRLDGMARGRFAIVRNGYKFFQELQWKNAQAIYFTSIAAENLRARRLLEKGARGLPLYRFLGELDTLAIAVPQRPQKTKLQVDRATPAHIPELLLLLNEQGRRRQLAAVWTAERIHSLERHGLPLDRFLVALEGGAVIACVAVWDQRRFRQTVFNAYSPVVSALRPVVNLTSRLFGSPPLPPAGSVLAHAYLSPLAVATGAEAILPDFIKAAFPLARQIGAEFLTIALPTTHASLPSLRKCLSTRTWRSRLYRVEWPDQTATEFTSGDPFIPDIALL
jgi:hypothetical protein